MTGSNIFRIFKQGVGLINGGLTAVVKFSNAIGDKRKRKTLKHHKNSQNYYYPLSCAKQK
jgi:hypothetical protein